MKKLIIFFNENKTEFSVSYLTFKKYLFENIEKFESCLKIVNNPKRKSYFVTDEKKFLEIFKA